MPIRHEISEGRVPVKVYTDDVEPQARRQLVNISRLPIVHHHVAAMPDVHLGIGATVGSVIPTVRAIIERDRPDEASYHAAVHVVSDLAALRQRRRETHQPGLRGNREIRRLWRKSRCGHLLE